MVLHYQPYTKQTERDELQWNYPWFHKGENKINQMNISNAFTCEQKKTKKKKGLTESFFAKKEVMCLKD